jgi:hypothetical protein
MAEAPYPGLRPFERYEADIFFGRESHIDAMIDRLAEHRLLAVTGSSGSGKSSLVRAGLRQGLEMGLLAQAGPNWRSAILRPGEHPMRALGVALFATLGKAGVKNGAALDRGPLSLLAELRERPLPGQANLLILVDQFEELFRYQSLGAREEAEAFVALLLGIRRQRDVRIYVVLTIRSDFLGECAQFEGLAEAINESLYLCPRLDTDQIIAAIERPAKVFGGEVEPRLLARLIDDMGTDPDQLPLMQHAFSRLWEQAIKRVPAAPILRLDDYLAAGGLKGSLSRHADDILEEVTRHAPEREETARRMFCLLVEGESVERAVRRPTPISDAMAVTGSRFQEIADIADAFRKPGRSFLLPASDDELCQDSVLDISHESLIRQWQVLRAWTHAETASAEQYRDTERRAQRWSTADVPLWDATDLDIALAWREREHPNAAWARRYGGDFDLAIRFLDASTARREATARRRTARRRLATAVLFVVLTVSLGGLAWIGLDSTRQLDRIVQGDLFCGATNAYILDKNEGSAIAARWIGVWTGQWSAGPVCSALVVKQVRRDGSVDVFYAFRPNSGNSGSFEATGTIDDNGKLSFQDAVRGQFSFKTIDSTHLRAEFNSNGFLLNGTFTKEP